MRNRTWGVLVSAVMLLAAAKATMANWIDWGVSSNYWKDHTNGLMHAGSDASSGWLVQLIHANGGVIHLPTNFNVSASGASGGDTVVMAGYFDTEFVGGDGQFVGASYANSYPNGDQFYFRAWEGVSHGGTDMPYPAPNTNLGTNGWWYGNSMPFTVAGNGSPPMNDIFEPNVDLGGSSGSYAMQFMPVPEPGIWMFLLVGVLVAVARRLFAYYAESHDLVGLLSRGRLKPATPSMAATDALATR